MIVATKVSDDKANEKGLKSIEPLLGVEVD